MAQANRHKFANIALNISTPKVLKFMSAMLEAGLGVLYKEKTVFLVELYLVLYQWNAHAETTTTPWGRIYLE